MKSRRHWPLLALFGSIAGALAFGAWTGFPVYSDALLPLLEREPGLRTLAENHADRPLYGAMLEGTVALVGFHPAVWVMIGLAAWSLLAWQTSLLWKGLFPAWEDWSWLPAVLVLSPIVVQTQFQTLTMVLPCVLPVSLVLAALLLGGLPGAAPAGAGRRTGALLLAVLAALVSEYGVAAAIASAALALFLGERRTTVLLSIGAGAGAALFRLTADASVRADVTAAAQLPKVSAAPLRALYQWLAGVWYSTIGAYGGAAWRLELDPESQGSLAAIVLGLLGAMLAALAARRAAANSDPGKVDSRRTVGLLLAVGAGLLPVVLAGRPASFNTAQSSVFETRFLLPVLPFAGTLVAAAILRVVAPRRLPAAVLLLAFLCVEESWHGAFQARRDQRWTQELGAALRPLVRSSSGITVAVVPRDPTRRWEVVLVGKMTLGWPVEEARRVWVLSVDHAVPLLGTRRDCRVGHSIRMPGGLRGVERSGPLAHVVWVPDAVGGVGEPEPYCFGRPR